MTKLLPTFLIDLFSLFLRVNSIHNHNDLFDCYKCSFCLNVQDIP